MPTNFKEVGCSQDPRRWFYINTAVLEHTSNGREVVLEF
jgi:hypothetical protein